MDQPVAIRGRIGLGDYEIDLTRGDLVSKTGALVKLRPRSTAVLLVLAGSLGQVVSKSEILSRVWDDAAVTEDSLTQCIADIRRALEDQSRTILRTMPRRGYVLVGKWQTDDTKEPEAAIHDSTISPPSTHYARSGGVHIAYQVTGSGPLDIVFVQGYVTHLELEWEDRRPARFYEQLGKIGRLIRFDKRGTGLSDRMSGLATLEERMDDVRAVMDAVGSERALLLGSSEGGPMSMLFCATYPQRVQGLILYGAMARFAWAPDNPWGRTAEAQMANIRTMEEKWGTGHSVDLFAPSEAADPAYRAWRARLDRAAASPGAVMSMSNMNFDIDVRHVLPSIRVPTLILHRQGEKAVNVEHSRYLARNLPHARYVELPGNDHAPWVGDTQAICDEIRRFATDTHRPIEPERVLATILIARFERSNHAIGLSNAIQDMIVRHRGRLIEMRDDTLFATFDGPARAVRCGQSILVNVAADKLGVRMGLHTGECEVDGLKLHGVAVEIAKAIVQHAGMNEMLASSTVRDLVAGSGLTFEHRRTCIFDGIPGEWTLLSPLI